MFGWFWLDMAVMMAALTGIFFLPTNLFCLAIFVIQAVSIRVNTHEKKFHKQ